MRILLALLLSALTANAATLYCGPSSTGSGSGADFNNRMACPDNTGFTRGNTYVLIEGSYGSKTFGTALSGTTTITIRYAGTADSAVAGYSSTLHDGQATFGEWTIHAGYLILSGTSRNETTWKGSYGFRMTGLSANSINGDNAQHSTFSYLDIGGTYIDDATSASGYGQVVYFVYNQHDLTFQKCWVHNCYATGFQLAGASTVLIEYCYLGPGWGKEMIRGGNYNDSDYFTIRYNKFINAVRLYDKAPPGDGAGLTAEIAIWDVGNTYTGHEIYGNLFYNIYTGGRNGAILIAFEGGTAANCKVYNNTFAGFPEASTYGDIYMVGSGNEAYNNLFYNTGSHSVSANSSGNNTYVTSNPFVSYGSDFHLNSAKAGTSFSSPYNTDMDGVTRGGDGTFDVGAFEYNSGAVDTNAPSVAITSHTNNQQVTTASISVSGTASDDTSLSSVTLTNTTTSTGFTVSGTTSWSATATVQLGTNYLRAIATDGAGNKATNTVYVVLVDSTAPSITITSPTNNQHTASSTGTVTGTASDNIALSTVTVTNLTTGVRVTTTGTTSWSGTATYTSGTNYIKATATDTSGNATSTTNYIVYDPTAPSVAITSPTNYQLTASSSGTVTGTASDTYLNTVTLTNTTTGVRVTISGTTSWSGTASYTAGTNYLRAIATDLAGNRATNTVYTYYDAVAPTVTAFVIPSTSQSLTVPITTFTASDNTSVAAYLVNTSSSTPSAGDAGWSATPQTEYVFSTDGNKTLYAWAKDAVGRISSSASDTVIVDLTNPSVTIQTPTSGDAYNTTAASIDLTGVASDVNLYTVEWSNDRGGSGSTAGTTSWSKSGIALQTGANVLTITATDIAGNVGTDTLTVTYSLSPTNRILRANHLRVGTLR